MHPRPLSYHWNGAWLQDKTLVDTYTNRERTVSVGWVRTHPSYRNMNCTHTNNETRRGTSSYPRSLLPRKWLHTVCYLIRFTDTGDHTSASDVCLVFLSSKSLGGWGKWVSIEHTVVRSSIKVNSGWYTGELRVHYFYLFMLFLVVTILPSLFSGSPIWSVHVCVCGGGGERGGEIERERERKLCACV